jgi:hypothetical protein
MSCNSCAKVLPPGGEAGQGQRVVLGDNAGALQSFYFKNGEFTQVFKTAPGPRKITSVVSGLGPTQRDKVFVAEGAVVCSAVSYSTLTL